MALCFLIQGAQSDERRLYVALSESEEELRASARCHGWRLDGVEVMEVVADEARLARQQSVFASGEFGLGETVAAVTERLQPLRPTCIVIDSLAEELSRRAPGLPVLPTSGYVNASFRLEAGPR